MKKKKISQEEILKKWEERAKTSKVDLSKLLYGDALYEEVLGKAIKEDVQWGLYGKTKLHKKENKKYL